MPFLAAEDWNYFKHAGLSVKGIIRSTLINLYSCERRKVQAPLPSNWCAFFFLKQKKALRRKIKEQITFTGGRKAIYQRTDS